MDYYKVYDFKDHLVNDGLKKVTFTLKTSDRSPVDLTGASIRAKFRKQTKTGEVGLSLSIGSGITVDDATGGKFSFDQINSLSLAVGYWYYDVEITFSDGLIKTYIIGKIKIIQDATNG